MSPVPDNKSNPFHNFVDDLIDGAKTSALERGVEQPGWSDVWKSLIHNPEFGSVLSARNIQTSALGQEIAFMERFSSLEASSKPVFTKEEIREALTDLSSELNSLRGLLGIFKPGEKDQPSLDEYPGDARAQEIEKGMMVYKDSLDLLQQRIEGQIAFSRSSPEEIQRKTDVKLGLIRTGIA